VNDYPFTTRGVTIGHILNPKPSVSIDNLLFDTSISSDISNNDDDNNRNSKKINKINLNDIKFQVMDTPGLLDRPDEERNEMERLTFASLAHLPTAVLFVIDPTGLSGEKSTLEAQLNVRSYLKSRFPKRPWLDVISKGDIEVSEEIQKILPSNHILVSVQSGKNIDILKSEIENMLFRLQSMLTTTSDE
jgi:nucleolar GTP-binding protein